MPPPDPAPLVALAPCPAPACVAAPARRHARGGRAAGPAGGAAGRVRRGRAAPGGRRRRAAAATARRAGLGGRVRAPRRGGRAARARRRGAAARGVRAAAGAPPRGHAGAAASAHGPQEAQHARGAGTVHALHLRAIQGGVSCPLSGRVGLWLGLPILIWHPVRRQVRRLRRSCWARWRTWHGRRTVRRRGCWLRRRCARGCA